jgi:hypothetical protein
MNFRIPRLLARSILVATAPIALACSDGVSEPTSPIGAYALASMNGNGIPATMFQEPGYSLRVIHGTLEVEADFTFVVAITTREVVDVVQSEYVDSLRGTWTLDEMNAMQFDVAGEEVFAFPGSWQGRKLTVLFTFLTSPSSFLFQRTN